MARNVAIVGGGAAGIFAALAAAEAGAKATIFERNKRIGIKILISGGGKCNITHDAPPRDIEEGFITTEARFLRYALHELTAADVLERLHARGLHTTTRPNGRVFPESGSANDVLEVFENMLYDAGVEIRANSYVDEVVGDGGCITGVKLGGAMRAFDAVIITTGGMSYKKVGTTGDGIRWGGALGHTIVPVRAALAPIYFPTPPPKEWQGVALRDAVLRVATSNTGSQLLRQTDCPTEWRGDVLLTHRGASGPCVLEVSRAAALLTERGEPATLVVDILPDTSPDELLGMWNDAVAASPKSEVQTFLRNHVPNALVLYVLDTAGMKAGIKLGETRKEERNRLLDTIKSWEIGAVGVVPIDRGEVTAGGIALDEISVKTMESELVKGLYVAGEALDVSGCVGGYNLQAAFSTGYVAGRSAATSE